MYKSMIKEPEIHEVLHLIKSANMVLHGIGDAITMAETKKNQHLRLSTNYSKMKRLVKRLAIILMKQGEIVHKVQTIGLQLEDLADIPIM